MNGINGKQKGEKNEDLVVDIRSQFEKWGARWDGSHERNHQIDSTHQEQMQTQSAALVDNGRLNSEIYDSKRSRNEGQVLSYTLHMYNPHHIRCRGRITEHEKWVSIYANTHMFCVSLVL